MSSHHHNITPSHHHTITVTLLLFLHTYSFSCFSSPPDFVSPSTLCSSPTVARSEADRLEKSLQKTVLAACSRKAAQGDEGWKGETEQMVTEKTMQHILNMMN